MEQSLPRVDSTDITITAMRRRHLRSVLKIEAQVYPRPWSIGLFNSEIGYRESRRYIVARVGTRVVGYGGLLLVLDDGHITTLAVHPAWHRQQIGTRLLHCLTSAAIDQGAKNLTLEVRASNHAAQGLYRAFGFAPAGIRKGYYPENKEDAIVMWVSDVDTDDYAARLARLTAGVTGATVVEELDHR